ncbi:hypothetical protein K439DRAFT_1644137 [Ramaria rubella]|nr:hypothetical protein K439DRAFT_1644137 [Ramaria rubella]
MEKYVTITKSAALADRGKGGGTSKNRFKYNPFPIPKAKERQIEAWRDKKRTENILAPLHEDKKHPSGSKALTKHLLNTLHDESNPITHSNIGQRSDHVDSCATGHQRGDSRRSSSYFTSRSKKLEEQRQDRGLDTNGILKGTRVYVGGYLASTTDIEIKRIVTLAGGKIIHTATGATHILTSQGLSGSKAHKHLHTASRTKAHVVTPEWVTDSIAAGKRKTERDYMVVKDSTVYELWELGVH